MSVDKELFDRQIRTYGFDAVEQLCNSSVCILGKNDYLCYEVCKNLVLSGINKLYLIDDSYLLKDSLLELNNNLIILNKMNKYDCNVLITINKSMPTIVEYNQISFKHGIKFISLISYEVEGSIFVDANNHLVKQISSENYEPIQIINISENGIVSCAEHNFQTNDYIRFNNLQGENIEIFDNEFIIQVINKNTFKIEIVSDFIFINGTCNYVHKSTMIKHIDFLSYFNKKEEMFNYYNKINYSKIDNQIQPVASIMGSICSSEVIKLITNKYIPINQFFQWSDNTLSFEKIINLDLLKTSWLVVGSGAIGCEILKNLANLNVGTIIITDPDTIEKSNLSRQFLFRNTDVGKLKSVVAAQAIGKLNPNINVIALNQKVGDDNNFINELFKQFGSVNGIFNALDNVKARKFMDEQAFINNLPLFESGTLGTKGNTQPVIPFITETYNDSTDPEIEKTFPVCTIKSFPNEILHCIHWALEQFELLNNENYNPLEIFNKNHNEDINKLLENFPINHLNDDGKLFWANGKKAPIPFNFDNNILLHSDFINVTNQIKLLKGPYVFDKDNVLFMNWIFIMSNLRANNYNIPNESFDYIKGIAGKIIPAVATTTSVVAGFIVLEMLKYLLKLDITDYKSTFVNLAENLIISAEPNSKKEIEINGNKFNGWYKFVQSDDCFLLEFKEKYEKMFNTKISIINCNSEILLSDFTEYENKLMSELVKKPDVISLISEDEEIILPNIYLA